MKQLILSIFLLGVTVNLPAHQNRDFLQRNYSKEQLKQHLVTGQKWVTYPAYADREGWDRMTGELKTTLIARGEEAANFDWQVVKATDFLEFERTGNRDIMQIPFNANRNAISSLVLAELAEGKGRFLDQIANGIWFFCEMTSWAYSAHMHHYNRETRSSLPEYNEHIIELASGDLGSFFAWTYHFLKVPLDKINPLISARLLQNLNERILQVYNTRENFAWQAFDATPLTKINNWTPWCNFNVLNSFLLLENDPDKLAAAVYRTMVSVDKFINFYHDDGACEEGTSYWSHAVGKLFDYLHLLQAAGVPMGPVFREPLIRKMGEYVGNTYIGNGWVVNYSDAAPRYKGPAGVIFRYGEAVGSDEMKQFASYLYSHDKNNSYIIEGDIFRILENLRTHDELAKTPAATVSRPSAWYPQSELLYMRNSDGFFFSAKGGTNQQSHNHNDVGSFILFHNHNPVFIDIGVGTYTRQTFSNERYSIWTMQSDYHNLPLINGASQVSFGTQRLPDDENFRAQDVRFDEKKGMFSLNIARSYHQGAHAKYWYRTFTFKQKGGLAIEELFELDQEKERNRISFMSQAKPDLNTPGLVRYAIGDATIALKYDASQLAASSDEIELTDKKLSNSWGDKVYRLVLTAKTPSKKGSYSFTIDKEILDNSF